MSEDGGRVLVADHEPDVAELQRLYLGRAGFEVRVASGPAAAPEVAGRLHPDAVVLDLSGPADPADLFRRTAAAAGAPVVCLTGPDAALPPGAAYQVTRPFGPRVLVAAVQEALRGRGDVPGLLRLGAVELDPHARTVLAGGAEVTLTVTEFELLAHLLSSPGRVFTREQLIAAAWADADGAGARTVDVHIAQLRAKLGGGSPIRTVRGVGYAADD